MLGDIPYLILKDVPFARRPVQCYGSRGTPFTKWIPYGMPHLGKYKWVKEIVFFLYDSEEAARAGEAAGGTGFLVGLPSRRWGPHFVHTHAVTNWHVACRGSSVIRINRRDGGTEILDFGPDQWIFEPRGPDLAASPPINLNTKDHVASCIGIENLLTNELEKRIDFDAAEDVFMIGRFVDYDGVETNEPAVRFGHVSITSANIKQETGFAGRSIILDMHSRSGFSGSPVFIYRTPGSGFAEEDHHYTGSMLYILGIHWGQFPERWELSDPKKSAEMARMKDVVTDGQYVSGLSGMTLVIPAQAISDLLLNNPELQAMREAEEIKMEEKIRNYKAEKPSPENTMTAWLGAPNASGERLEQLNSLLNQVPTSTGKPVSEVAVPPATDANPTHREDFTRLLGAAARKPPQED